jgi:hypothetical protein
MKRLFPLIPSPRAAKRFVNVYRLFRATLTDADYDSFIREKEGDYPIVLLLLAMLTGHPMPTTEILRELLDRPGEDDDWWEFLDKYRARRAGPVTDAAADEGQGSFDDRLEAERWDALWTDLDSIRKVLPTVGRQRRVRRWAQPVARFSFHSGRLLTDRGLTVRSGPSAAPRTN